MPVLLFYHYCDVADPAALAVQQRHLCHSLGLTGRVRVASEGINATLGGDRAACAAYERELASDPRFGAVEFKRGEGGAGDFDGLLVKESTEIVTLGIPPAELSFRDGGARLSPAQFREGVMAVAAAREGGGGDTVLIDCRNAYESRIGCFDGALAPPTRQFSDFPAWCREHRSELQGRNVLMYCTGGIRCERASAYVLGPEVGAAAVGQLHGGIHRFLEEWPDGGGVWKGKNLVFDRRVAIGTTPASRVPQAVCDLCLAAPCDDYTADARCRHCRARLLACLSCTEALRSDAAVDGALCRECTLKAGRGELKSRAATGRECWPHLREAGLSPTEGAKGKNGPKPGGRRKVRLKYCSALSTLLEPEREPEREPDSVARKETQAKQAELAWPQLSGLDAVDSSLLCFFLLQPDVSDDFLRAGWRLVLSGRAPASDGGEAEEAVADFAATAAPSSGCALLLWRAHEGLDECRDDETRGAPPADVARKVTEGGAGCLALWKESDGRTVHRLYPGPNDEEDAPLLGTAAANCLLRALRECWGGALAFQAGARYRGAAPKAQIQRLIKVIRA